MFGKERSPKTDTSPSEKRVYPSDFEDPEVKAVIDTYHIGPGVYSQLYKMGDTWYVGDETAVEWNKQNSFLEEKEKDDIYHQN